MYPAVLLCILIVQAITIQLLPRKFVPRAYDPVESRQFALMSGLAYCPRKCLIAWNCQSGKEISDFAEVTHVFNDLTLAAGYVGYQKSRNMIIVAFRGSANAQNWIEDFIFDKIEYDCKGCLIHQGFLGDYLLIEAQVDAAVKSLKQKHATASILTTGHSLGGALSEISGLRLKNKMGGKVEVHNFGCPRIGNQALSRYISLKVDGLYRVVHNKDIVPHLPPEPLEFHHSAFEVFFDEDMKTYKICNDSGEDSTCSNQFAPKYSAADHDIYFMALSSLKC